MLLYCTLYKPEFQFQLTHGILLHQQSLLIAVSPKTAVTVTLYQFYHGESVPCKYYKLE